MSIAVPDFLRGLVAGFASDQSMLLSIVRAVFFYGLFTSLVGFLIPKKFRFWCFREDNKVQVKTAKDEAFKNENEKIYNENIKPCDLSRVFSIFDKNGDGRISKEEMEESLGVLGLHLEEEALCEAISHADSNGDGFVDLEEFSVLYDSMKAKCEHGEDTAEDEEDLKNAFRVFDGNGDGLISVEELHTVLASLGLKEGSALSACRSMISTVDTDGDGMVNFSEFKNMMMRKNGSINLDHSDV